MKLPPSFFASQVYLPSSLSVTFVKSRGDVFSLGRRCSSFKKDSSGFGKPSIILHVRLALSPSRKGSVGPNSSTTGRTTEKNKIIKTALEDKNMFLKMPLNQQQDLQPCRSFTFNFQMAVHHFFLHFLQCS